MKAVRRRRMVAIRRTLATSCSSRSETPFPRHSDQPTQSYRTAEGARDQGMRIAGTMVDGLVHDARPHRRGQSLDPGGRGCALSQRSSLAWWRGGLRGQTFQSYPNGETRRDAPAFGSPSVSARLQIRLKRWRVRGRKKLRSR